MSDPAEPVQLDLNNPVFQRQWFALPKEAQWSVLGTLRKLAGMSWSQVYQDRGLRPVKPVDPSTGIHRRHHVTGA